MFKLMIVCRLLFLFIYLFIFLYVCVIMSIYDQLKQVGVVHVLSFQNLNCTKFLETERCQCNLKILVNQRLRCERQSMKFNSRIPDLLSENPMLLLQRAFLKIRKKKKKVQFAQYKLPINTLNIKRKFCNFFLNLISIYHFIKNQTS